MNISLAQLIQIAPFPLDHKQKLIDAIPKMSEDQKYRLTDVAWHALAQQHFSKLAVEKEKAMEEVIYEERKSIPDNSKDLEAKLLQEFSRKLEAVNTQESIEEIKKQLEKYNTNTSSQTNTIPSPSPTGTSGNVKLT